jgi:hypothetical protein
MRLGADLGSHYGATDRRSWRSGNSVRKWFQVGLMSLGDELGEADDGVVTVRTRLEYGWKYTYL